MAAWTGPVRTPRTSMQVDTVPSQIKLNLKTHAYGKDERWSALRIDKLPAGPDLRSGSTMGQPEGHGERNIQIDGLRVPCESRSLQVPGDQHGLVFRCRRRTRAYPDMVDCLHGHTEPRFA